MTFPPAIPGFDPSGGVPLNTEHGPAVFVPLAWLAKRQIALVCADRCIRRMGQAATAHHVMQEAARLMGECRFSHDTAERAMSDLRDGKLIRRTASAVSDNA